MRSSLKIHSLLLFAFFGTWLNASLASPSAQLRSITVETRPQVHGVVSVRESTPKQPLVLLLGGFETGQRAIDLFSPPPGVALASLDYPFVLEGKWTAETLLRRGLELRRALRAVDDGLCSFLAKVAEDPRIDAQNIIAVGASFGAPYALAAASRCGGVKALILLQGFGDVPGALAARMKRGLERKVGGGLTSVLAPILGKIGWLSLGLESPEKMARAVDPKIPVLLVEAGEDDLIPESSKRALVEAFSKHPRFELQTVPGMHLRPGNPHQIRDLLQRSLVWLNAQGILKL